MIEMEKENAQLLEEMERSSETYLPSPPLNPGLLPPPSAATASSTSLEDSYATKMKYVSLLRSRPIAIETATANEQHYEVGTGVLKGMLGARMKYSCCLYEKGGETLGAGSQRFH